ncbi:MAG TPA: hypothetical protein VM942_10830, partial [Acidimicrobiales bacterium]|nr:hypothetical protein [Acidimicrobiales bacterium]
MTVETAAWQVRVHGVGGPQGRKILGVLSEDDTETLGPDPVTVAGVGGGQADTAPDGTATATAGAASAATAIAAATGAARGAVLTQVPADTDTRVMRRPEDHGIEAYEWGGLTLGSTLKTLWVVFLPLTVLNASGWSHKPGADRRSRGLMHVVCGLGTLTYVGWIGYVLVDLVGRQWRDRLASTDLVGPLEDVVRGAGLPLAHVLFVVVLCALWKVNRRSGAGFEGRSLGDAAADWNEGTEVTDPRFFGHELSHARLVRRHVVVAIAGALAVVALGLIDRQVPAPDGGGATISSIGAGLVFLGLAQGVLLLAWWLTTILTRDFARAATATLGTVLCHATFIGVGITLVEQLSGWPKVGGARPIVSGAELALGDHFLYGAVAGAVAVLVLAAVIALRTPERPGYDPAPRLGPRLVRSAPTVASLLALGFMASLVAFFVLQARHLAGDGPIGWYEGYRVEGNAAQEAVGLVLGGIPLAIVGVLRRPRDGVFAQVLGNVWDVLTFWPRRFHPLAAPPYAERAVPELRWVIRRRRRADRPLVVVAHSQGTVLALAAIGAELRHSPARGPVSLLGFGSPVGTLYASMFPAYFGQDQRRETARRIEASGGRWWNLFRATDPISGPVLPGAGSDRVPQPPPTPTSAWYDKQLPDPRPDFVPNPVPPPVPLERARPWGVVNGHNFYLADPTT